MEIMEQGDQFKDVKENTILGKPPKMSNSKIVFKGKGNILYCEDDVHLTNSSLVFNGDNSLIYLSNNRHTYYLNTTINHDSVFYMGSNNYLNGKLTIVLSEQKNVIIGNDGLFSFNIWIRTADPHLIYDVNTKRRINDSRSIFLGDHVWVGQSALILKGTQVGSGSIIGASSVVSGKLIESNTSYAGNPAKKISEDIFFTGDSVHAYREKETKKHEVYEGDNYIYQLSEDTLSFADIESKLTSSLSLSSDKLDYLKATLNNMNKNRFFIGEKINKQRKYSLIKKLVFVKKPSV